MSYTATHAARLKDAKTMMTKIKTITDNHEQRLVWLEQLAKSLLDITNSVITNVTK